jgi:DNA invertase Pin-like site-specific DNA recombinase
LLSYLTNAALSHEALQIDALKEAGCEKWFLDKITGSKAERKGLDEALAHLRPGDTLVVWKLVRAGRSLTHLIDLLRGLKERGIEFISLTITHIIIKISLMIALPHSVSRFAVFSH